VLDGGLRGTALTVRRDHDHRPHRDHGKAKSGGGILLSSAGTLTIDACDVSNNQASRRGSSSRPTRSRRYRHHDRGNKASLGRRLDVQRRQRGPHDSTVSGNHADAAGGVMLTDAA